MIIKELLFLFFVISFIGWVWETFICSYVEYGGALNRGFFIGPYCPIYGLGAIISFLLFYGYEADFKMFLITGFISCLFEYIVGVTLEKIFKKSYWDYNRYPFNFQGRVCLYGFIVFGLGNILFLKYGFNFLLNFLYSLPINNIYAILITLSILFIFDFTLTFSYYYNLSSRGTNIYHLTHSKIDDGFDYLNSNISYCSDTIKSNFKNYFN